MEWSLFSALDGLGKGMGKAGTGGMKLGRVERNGMKGVLLPCGDQRLLSGTAELANGSVRYERVKGAFEAVREMCRGTGETLKNQCKTCLFSFFYHASFCQMPPG